VRESGVVKSYFEAKGFGFIRARGVEYFFHVSDVRPEKPKAIIQPGRPVEFEATQTRKGARAVDVVLL
jgi:cold shock CspA family protein